MHPFDLYTSPPGIHFLQDGSSSVLLWAPECNNAELIINDKQTIALQKIQYGFWHLNSNLIRQNDLYYFLIDHREKLPDPASLSQPKGVHGPSQIINLNSFEWHDQNWTNPPIEKYILYELHTGTFTADGSFLSIIDKLDHLRSLGITAIEIMPIAQFPGTRNWGYDGVFPYAVQNSYGGAKNLQALVDACHQKEIAVVLDVVYNHLGPEGNYLVKYAPYFTSKYKTPWGDAINFDDAGCDGVRHYFIQNALMWFRDFHIDALRLDAVHAIKDLSPVHILADIKTHVDELIKQTGKKYYLMAECDLNDTRLITPLSQYGYGFDAQWNDEFHHALRVTAGQKRYGYYADFEGIGHLAKAYQDAYVYDGQYSETRKRKFGIKTTGFPGKQFVVFSQNHDQTGNRVLGERTSHLVSFEMQKLMAAAVMVSPFIPMLFMGEEWSETHPFLYFVDHSDEALSQAVRKGRKEEFKTFAEPYQMPDPTQEETFRKSKIQWQLLTQEPNQTMLSYYHSIIELRKKIFVLNNNDRTNLEVQHDKETNTLMMHRWDEQQHVICLMNFSSALQNMIMPDQKKHWKNVFDSADPKWKGKMASPVLADAGSQICVQPESILIFINYYV